MAPTQSRQVLIWTIPTIAVILGYFWYKRKSIAPKTDPGTTQPPKTLATKTPTKSTVATPVSTPNRSFSRSLSGVDTAPIDIIIPAKLKATKSNPVVISDEDLDREIEKIKSMRFGHSVDLRPTVVTSEMIEGRKREASPPQPAVVVVPPPVLEEKVEKRNSLSNESHRQSSERDSANHSPADVMLASPSLSSISDNHSEGSNDSGKGGSEVVTPPPSRSLAVDSNNVVTIYEFIIPQQLVGKLIGKHGSSVSNIKDKTGAHVVVKKHPTNNKLKVCSIEGNEKEIQSALKIIRDKFPLKRFPEVTLEQVPLIQEIPTVPLISDHLYLKLIEGINNDTTVSCIVTPNHLFLQQPTHPSFLNLNILNGYMNVCYSEAGSPMLPTPIPENTVCAARSCDNWFRAMIISVDQTSGTCYVKFLDYGGYADVEYDNLRQIRGDFMMLPFQAAECFLANIEPTHESGWQEEALSAVSQMTKGAIVYTQIVDYTEEGIPLVYCYLLLGPDHVVFLNQELVNQGHAKWINVEEGATGVTVSA